MQYDIASGVTDKTLEKVSLAAVGASKRIFEPSPFNQSLDTVKHLNKVLVHHAVI